MHQRIEQTVVRLQIWQGCQHIKYDLFQTTLKTVPHSWLCKFYGCSWNLYWISVASVDARMSSNGKTTEVPMTRFQLSAGTTVIEWNLANNVSHAWLNIFDSVCCLFVTYATFLNIKNHNLPQRGIETSLNYTKSTSMGHICIAESLLDLTRIVFWTLFIWLAFIWTSLDKNLIKYY